jgi:hypothetical protein
MLAGVLSSCTSSFIMPLAGVLSADVVHEVRDAHFSSIAADSFL